MIVTTTNLTDVLTRARYGGWAKGELRNVTLKGLTFKATGDYAALRLPKASSVIIDGCAFRGDPENPHGIGVDLPDSQDVVIINSLFEGLETGIKAVRGNGLAVDQNEFRRIMGDGVVYSGQADYEITDNLFHDWRAIPGGKHADAIQSLRPDDRNPPSVGGLIARNTIRVRGAQAIFVPESIDTVVAENHIQCDMANGIGGAKSTRLTLRDNRLATLQGASTICRIELREVVDARFEGVNIAAAYANNKQIVYPATR